MRIQGSLPLSLLDYRPNTLDYYSLLTLVSVAGLIVTSLLRLQMNTPSKKACVTHIVEGIHEELSSWTSRVDFTVLSCEIYFHHIAVTASSLFMCDYNDVRDKQHGLYDAHWLSCSEIPQPNTTA